MRPVGSRELRHGPHLVRRRPAGDPDVGEVRLVKGGQHRDRQYARPVGAELRGRVRSRANHGLAADRVYRHEVDAQTSRRPDRTLDSPGDVVELEVEKHFLAKVLHCLDHIWPLGREQLEPDLVEAHCIAYTANRLDSRLPTANIQSNYQFRHLHFPFSYFFLLPSYFLLSQ